MSLNTLNRVSPLNRVGPLTRVAPDAAATPPSAASMRFMETGLALVAIVVALLLNLGR